MQIAHPNLTFTGLLALRRKTERIIIHHAATYGDVNAAMIHQWHLNRGWKGIGYHYVVGMTGLIEEGRNENSIGSHSGASGNSNSIGICLAGNFMVNKPTDAQIMALVTLIKDIFSRRGILLIQGHNEVMATACPGKFFPMDYIKKSVLSATIYPTVRIVVGGHELTGYLFNGRTIAPARQLLDIMQMPFTWEASSNSVVVGFYKLPAKIIDGVGYIEVRELVAAFDREVKWDASTRTATIQ